MRGELVVIGFDLFGLGDPESIQCPPDQGFFELLRLDVAVDEKVWDDRQLHRDRNRVEGGSRY